MRNDWNDELRRAYDQGYWDARREFEQHLQREHGGGEGERREGYGGGWTPEPNDRARYEGKGSSASGYGSHDDRSRSAYGGSADRAYDTGGRRDRESYRSQSSRHGYHSEYDGAGTDRGDYNDYPPGDRRSAIEHRDDRGFLERAGDTISSWLGGDDDRQSSGYRSSGSGRSESGYRDESRNREGHGRNDRMRDEQTNIWW